MTLHFFHRWTPWRVIKEGPLLNERDEHVGTYIVQTRQCNVCGKIRLREERAL
jgi:hypothetical protein